MGKKVSEPRDTASFLNSSQAGLYRTVVKNLPLGMAVLHLAVPSDVATWQVVAINSLASRIGGSSAAALLNLSITPRARGKAPVKLESLCRHVVARNRGYSAGHLSFATPGSREFYDLSVFPLDQTCAALLFRDVTLLRETTRELIGTHWQIAQMCESSGSILWRARPITLEFTHVTPQAEEILGYWIERWRQESNFWKNRVHTDDWHLVEDSCAKAAKGEKMHFDCRMFSAHGEIRWFRVHVQKAELSSGRPELTGVMIDITDQKRTAEASRELSIAVMRAQEQERKIISRELHDSIGQYLTGLNYKLGRLGRSRAKSKRISETVRECIETVQACMKEIRSVSYMLRPPLVDLLGLGPALCSYANKFVQQSGIRLEVDVPQEKPCLDTDSQMALFRIAQECLTNIQRHARTESARIQLLYLTGSVVLEVQDYGVGIDPDLLSKLERGAAGSGLGMLKMRERVLDLKGSLNIEANGGGTTVRVQIPESIELLSARNPKAGKSAARERKEERGIRRRFARSG